MIYIGSDLPDEYTHSNYTRILKGANAKAKANAAQGLPELLKIATNEVYEDNRKEKHSKDAKYGWYSYDSRFALPVFGDDGEIKRYNVFNINIARILLPLQVGDELRKNEKNTCSMTQSVV